jgi:hypothetical protein
MYVENYINTVSQRTFDVKLNNSQLEVPPALPVTQTNKQTKYKSHKFSYVISSTPHSVPFCYIQIFSRSPYFRYAVYQVKEDELVGLIARMGEMKDWSEEQKGRDHSEDLGVDGRIILVGRCRLDSSGSR